MADQVSPEMLQWREMFSSQVEREFKHVHEKLDGITLLLQTQNGRVRTMETSLTAKADADDCQVNTLEIARLKTWVALVGSLFGLMGIVLAVLQMVR